MVAYTAPVFWTFFLLCGIALLVFRAREGAPDGFRVPLFPLVPLVFCGVCGYMLYSSVNYVRFAVSFGGGVLAGIIVMALGVPLYFLARRPSPSRCFWYGRHSAPLRASTCSSPWTRPCSTTPP